MKKDISDQLKVLKKLYPRFKFVGPKERKLPDGAEIALIVPKLSAVAKLHKIKDPYGKDYGKVLEIALNQLGKSRPFTNYREGELTDKHIRLLSETRKALEELEKGKGDYIVIPYQSGQKWRGKSIQDAREQMTGGEFPAPSWFVIHHLLTYPDRLQRYEDLWIDCAGDEYSADGRFGGSLYVVFNDEQVGFDNTDVDGARACCGTASGFRWEYQPSDLSSFENQLSDLENRVTELEKWRKG